MTEKEGILGLGLMKRNGNGILGNQQLLNGREGQGPLGLGVLPNIQRRVRG